MKKVNTTGITSAVLIMIVGMIFMLQSCDLTSQEEPFENPYTEKTEQTFGEISESVFDNIAVNIKDKAYDTVTRDDIMRYANEGYIEWAQNNGVEENAFNAGVEASRSMKQLRIKNGTKSSGTNLGITDSLLIELDLDETQKNYILQLPEIVGQSGNIAKLERKLNQFDEKVYKQLGEEDSKPVLQLSALIKASMEFVTTNAKMLGTLAELVEENTEQSYFYHPSLINESNTLFHLAQSQEGPTDPPEWGDYFSEQDLAMAVVLGAAAGGLIGMQAGSAVGSLGGPWGPAIGGAVGGLGGFIGGGAGAGGYYYQNRLDKYGAALTQWCGDSINISHRDYGDLCSESE